MASTEIRLSFITAHVDFTATRLLGHRFEDGHYLETNILESGRQSTNGVCLNAAARLSS